MGILKNLPNTDSDPDIDGAIARTAKIIGGFDVPPCEFCRRETPCGCLRAGIFCACACGRCRYPYPLPDDGPLPSAEG